MPPWTTVLLGCHWEGSRCSPERGLLVVLSVTEGYAFLLHPYGTAGLGALVLLQGSSIQPWAALLLLLPLKPGQSGRGLILPRPGWAALEALLSLELAGDYVWGGRVSQRPVWNSPLQGPFPKPRAGAAWFMLAPCSLPGKWHRAAVQLRVREPVQP